MPTVLITPEAMRHVEGPYVQILREAGFDVRYPRNPQFARGISNENETIDELREVDATIASGERYTRTVLESLPRLRVIARCGVGYDRVDVDAATDHGISVTITPTSNRDAVAELALALMLAVAKSLVFNDAKVRHGHWPRRLLLPLREKTLGIVGMGRIGSSLAFRAVALGMRVIAFEPNPNREFARTHKIALVDLATLLAHSDFVSIHCPLTEDTRGLFDQHAFSQMKPGSILINTSRGPIVVEQDLVAALQSGHLRGAGLDVYAEEPPSIDNPLLKLDNVVLSPHLAGTDESSLEGMGVEAARCICELSRGDWPSAAVVNPEVGEGWRWDRSSG
jgi:phosphoglycerate dehydrogenase-like enzyme